MPSPRSAPLVSSPEYLCNSFRVIRNPTYQRVSGWSGTHIVLGDHSDILHLDESLLDEPVEPESVMPAGDQNLALNLAE